MLSISVDDLLPKRVGLQFTFRIDAHAIQIDFSLEVFLARVFFNISMVVKYLFYAALDLKVELFNLYAFKDGDL